MPRDPALVQLMDMGIPGGRARAALKRTKGDVMSAAERVFGGDFDDVPSDDEEDDEEVQAVASSSKSTVPPAQLRDDEDDPMSDGGESAGYGGEQDYVDTAEEHLLEDPYAGVFFSKDRVEKVIEPVEKEERVEVRGEKGKAAVRVLGRGQWMSGCPKGNEQSFLFQLYSQLEDGEIPCAQGCGHRFAQRKSNFLALFPDFPSYIAHVSSFIRPTCPRCSHKTCLACGEGIARKAAKTRGAAMSLEGSGSSGKEREPVKGTSEVEVDELLHCPNIQGVIIGIGLHMIEQTFASARGSSSAAGPAGSLSKTRPTKKRKSGPEPVPKPTGLLSGMLSNLSASGASGTAAEMLAAMDEYDSDEYMYGGGVKGQGRAGTGYAGAMNEDRRGQEAAQEAQTLADAKTAQLLSQVKTYLPNLNRASGPRTSDHLVHPIALAHLRRRSGFVNDLLQNDSLLDMSNRGDLYRTLFDWLEVVSSHESLASMLAMPQMRPVNSEPLANDADSIEVTYEGARSPRELLENCVIQATAALRGLEATAKRETADGKDDEADGKEGMMQLSKEEAEKRQRAKVEALKLDENHQLAEFCRRIMESAQTIDKSLVECKGRAFVERMREMLPRLTDVEASAEEPCAGGATSDAVVKIYEKWASQVRFKYVDLSRAERGKVSYLHAFSAQIVGMDNVDAPKRSLAIAKELAILTTSLPAAFHSTIFLRVDEARVDCLKAMIIGPEGTPYENGCFIFDIFLPIDYNYKCPSVKSMTTNGGKYRYNPNLYADGKVCLSLLGTWSGPGWISGQSTLLQVLISIQSLILCEEPYLNEPGWAGQGGSAASKAYSANVRRMVLVDAMANNIKNPPCPFENEIRTHFRLKADVIRKQLETWKKLDDGQATRAESYGEVASAKTGNDKTGSRSETAFDKAAKVMNGLLDGLAGANKKQEVGGKGASLATRAKHGLGKIVGR